MIVGSALYDTALGQSVRIDRQHIASQIAQKKIEELRSWSRKEHGTNGLLVFPDQLNALESDSDDEDHPGYRVKVEVDDSYPLYAPASSFEEVHFSALEDDVIADDLPFVEASKRRLPNSAALVTTTVSWGSGPKDQLISRSLLTDPVRDLGWGNIDLKTLGEKAIQFSYSAYASGDDFITPPPGTLIKNGTIRIKADIVDANLKRVDNLGVRWYLDSKSTGNVTLASLPEAPNVVLVENVVEVETELSATPETIEVYNGGSIRLVARVRTQGIDIYKVTREFKLVGD